MPQDDQWDRCPHRVTIPMNWFVQRDATHYDSVWATEWCSTATEWCNENFSGQWLYRFTAYPPLGHSNRSINNSINDTMTFGFRNLCDAVYFKLRWYNGPNPH